MNNYYILNTTERDIILSDLRLKLKCGSTPIDILKYNPSLKPEDVERSLKSGTLKEKIKKGHIKFFNENVILDIPEPQKKIPVSKVATGRRFSRKQTIDPNKKTFVEELESELDLESDLTEEERNIALKKEMEDFVDAYDLDGFVDVSYD